MMKWMHRLGYACGLATTALVLLASVPAAPIAMAAPRATVARKAEGASLTCNGNWQVVPSPSVAGGSGLFNVAAASANDVWAVGGGGSANLTLIEHWNGQGWQIVPTPTIKGGGDVGDLIDLARVPGSRTVWAVGFSSSAGPERTLIEQWNGTTWQIVPSPNIGSSAINDNELSAVVAISANDVWAVGTYVTATDYQATLIEHWNGTRWQIVPSPNAGVGDSLDAVASVPGSSTVWAVGYYFPTTNTPAFQTLAERWNGLNWQIVPSPKVGVGADYTALNGVAGVPGSRTVWAVGIYAGGPLIDRWNGTAWQVASSPSVGPTPDSLNAVAAVSASDVWAVGSANRTLIEHWNGTRWQVVPSPNVGSSDNTLLGVAQVPGSSTLWAVGSYQRSNGYTSGSLTEVRC